MSYPRTPTKCWLTLNRKCNLRCEWCYAKNTGYSLHDEMTVYSAKKIIDLLSEIGVGKISLIGGEPTCYSGLFEVIEYAQQQNLNTTLITNGVALADNIYLDNLMNSGLSKISLSMKGYNRKNYEEVTGYDGYNSILKAIANLSTSNIDFSVSMVLNNKNIEYFSKGIADAVDYGANFISLSFCYDFSNMLSDNNYKLILKDNPFYIVNKFTETYTVLNNITQGKFSLFQSYPLCIWD